MTSLLRILILLSACFSWPALASQEEGNFTAYAQGEVELKDEPFHYTHFKKDDAKVWRIEVVHMAKKYRGELAKLSIEDRFDEVRRMIAGLMASQIKENCTTEVTLSDIEVSLDPDEEEDPQAEHPQYFMWGYSCENAAPAPEKE